MAKGFLALTDDKLSEVFSFVPPDLTKARKPFIAALDKALKQFEEGKQPRGANALWSANNNAVKFTPKAGGVPVEVYGKTEHFIPAERFGDAIKELREEVEAGKHDDALSVDPATNPKRAAAAQSSAKPQRAGWTPERRAKYEATQAAKAK